GSLTPIYIEPNRAFVIYRIESQPAVGDQLSATFDQGISLLQYEVSVNKPVTETADIRDIGIYLDWRAQQPLTESYKVFVHISDTAGNIVAQDDSLPQLWTYPTTDWKAGERIADFHRIRLKVTPGAAYQVVIGLYDAATANRLNLLDATGAVTADQFILQTINFP
ncbi:MAG TPA: hypothetical protein VFK30_00125, partial [Anaerolineae bacterium]|nr:hypothetical protein [Anaerolineae bacterium]